jgi:drug/metabolite transporter (DMT)-like permease
VSGASPEGAPRGALDYGILIVLSLIWGSTFILYKEALRELSWPQVGLIRVMVSALVLLPLAPRLFRRVPAGRWTVLAAVGLFGSGLPPFLFALAQTGLDSGVTGILNALTPVFTLLIGLVAFRLSVGPWRVAGLLSGLAGAAWIVATEAGGFGGKALYGGYVLLATTCYGTATNLIKARLQEVPPLTITVFSLGFLALPALAFLPFSGLDEALRQGPAAWRAAGYVVLMALAGTVLASWLYFRLVQRTDVVFASVITYLIPVVALAWGLASGERLLPGHAAGLALILVAVRLIGRRPKAAPPRPEAAAALGGADRAGNADAPAPRDGGGGGA